MTPSERVERYLREYAVRSDAPRSADLGTRDGDGQSLPRELAAAVPLAHAFHDRYGGLMLPIAGGPLWPGLLLGVFRGRPIWQTSSGEVVFRAAEHDEAQCAFTLSTEGVFAAAWSREFTALLDSFAMLLEHCALWAAVQRWHYAWIDTAAPEAVTGSMVEDLAIQPQASGRLGRSWLGADTAVFAAPNLTGLQDGHPQVCVLVRDHTRVADVRRRLHGLGENPSSAAEPGYRPVPALAPNPGGRRR